MFIGEYTHSLDTKGRVALPAKFRPKLGDGAIIARGLDHCLFVFTKESWEKLTAKIAAMSFMKSDSRAFARLMLAGASEVEFDNQGRILIPEYLRIYASLKKQAIFAGLYDRIEIWDEANWKSYKSKTEASSDDIAEKLGELGI
ncbi:MAG: division/cell wall cluster transcriptional repressor MraZ [bacterium]|nr:division/cell wall cluster transcriptional repressor MraZ [bacterium]